MNLRQTFSFLALLSLLVFTGCLKEKTDEQASSMADFALNVQTAKAVQRDVQLHQTYTGKVVPVSQVDIVPRIRGYLEAIKYTDGSIVDKGQLLFTIQDFDYKIDVEKARADMVAAKAREMSTKSTYESAVKSNQKVAGTVSENDIIKYKSQWQQAYADYMRSITQYRYQLQQLSYTKICSPIRGKISKTIYTPGQLLDGTTANPPVMCTVISMDPIYVEFQVSDREFDKALAHAQKNFFDQKQHLDSNRGFIPTSPTAPQSDPQPDSTGAMNTNTVAHQVAYTPEDGSVAPALPTTTNVSVPVAPVAEATPATDVVPTVENTVVENTVVDNTVVDNTAVDNTVVDNTAVDNTVVDNTVVDNTVVDNTVSAPVAETTVQPTAPAVNPVTELKAEVTATEQSADDDLAKPFIPKDEDIAPSAVLKDNAAFMAGEDKAEAVIPFTVRLADDPNALVFKGNLNYNANEIDTSTGTMTLRGIVANPKYQLYPGHICTVQLEGYSKTDVIVIEERAIVTDLNTKFVWTVDENGTAVKRYIEAEDSFEHGTLRIIGSYREMEVISPDGTKSIKKTGLKAGETYIVEGFQKLREGMKVNDMKLGNKTATQSAPEAK